VRGASKRLLMQADFHHHELARWRHTQSVDPAADDSITWLVWIFGNLVPAPCKCLASARESSSVVMIALCAPRQCCDWNGEVPARLFETVGGIGRRTSELSSMGRSVFGGLSSGSFVEEGVIPDVY
jgi:hypothetical protein